MLNRKILPVLGLLASFLVPATSFAQSPARAPCILREHHLGSVTPYQVEEHVGKATIRRLRGASVFVQAEPGLTAEWLQLTLTRHITAMRGATMADCAFDVDDVTVQVDSAGTGFSVKIVARDSDKAEEVLRRVRLLLG